MASSPLSHEGVRFEAKTEYVQGTETLRPLRDQIVVRPLEWNPSKVLATVTHKRTLRGVVVAVGPGHYPWKYSADRARRWESKVFQKTQVKVGDTVELGGLEIDGYSFPQVMIGNERHVICREADVCGVICTP